MYNSISPEHVYNEAVEANIDMSNNKSDTEVVQTDEENLDFENGLYLKMLYYNKYAVSNLITG